MQYAQIFLTFRCDQSCDFCFNKGLTITSDMSSDDFRKLSLILKEHGSYELDILGGEPLLHKEIFHIIEIAEKNFDKIYMSTNGVFLDKLIVINRIFTSIKIGLSINSEINKDFRNYILSYRPIIKSVSDRRNFFYKRNLRDRPVLFFDLPGYPQGI